MSVNFQPDTVPASYDVAAGLAAEFGVRLGIHNHGGRHWLGCRQMLSHVFANTDASIGLCLDTAWAIHSHEDPVAMVEAFADRLSAVHVKDFVFDRVGQHEDVVIGTGALDLTALMTTMAAQDFDGCFILEYEADIDNPVPALAECVRQVAKTAAALG